jgi:hypothetical protein
MTAILGLESYIGLNGGYFRVRKLHILDDTHFFLSSVEVQNLSYDQNCSL